jgi:hypothetical protein
MIYNFIESVERQLEQMLESDDFVVVDSAELIEQMFGDRRAAFRVWVNTVDECIVVNKYTDRSLQYYGGFEYVPAEYRKEIGDYVIYMGMNERVSDAVGAALEAV